MMDQEKILHCPAVQTTNSMTAKPTSASRDDSFDASSAESSSKVASDSESEVVIILTYRYLS